MLYVREFYVQYLWLQRHFIPRVTEEKWIVNFRGIFLNYYSENVIKERVVAFLTTVAICVKQLIPYVTYEIQKGYVICPFSWFLICLSFQKLSAVFPLLSRLI